MTAPAAIEYDPFDTLEAAPYALYARLRDEAPVYFASPTATFVLSRYDDVHRALTSPDLYSSDAMRGVLMGQPTGKGEQRLPRSEASGNLVSIDPPEHSELRSIVARGFTPRRIGEWRARIDEIVAGLAAGWPIGEPFDLVEQLAAPLPVRTICELLGADPEEGTRFRGWADAMTSVLSGSARVNGFGPDEFQAILELTDDIGRRIDERHEHPRDDLLTTLVLASGDDVLSRAEAVGFASLLLFAGTETTTNLISNAVAALLDRPSLLEALRADPALIPKVIEEVLRWESPVQYVFRRTTRDLELHGVELPVDSTVTLLLGSANRDPRRWGGDAEQFEVTRDTGGHLAFGFGVHYCLGASLARIEAESALRALLPRLSATGPRHAPAWIDSMQFRGHERLEIVVTGNDARQGGS